MQRALFDYQFKPKGFEGMSKTFIDSNGKQYYRYDDDFDIPLLRKQKIEEALIELSSMVGGDELKLFLGEMKKLINKAIYSNEKGKVTNLAEIMLLVEEMDRRKDMLIHEDILFKLIGAMHIREDQQPHVWDYELENEKIKQFKKDSQTGLKDFFWNAGLKRYVPFLEVTENEFNQYLHQSRIQIQALHRFISGELSSVNGKTTDL